MIEMEMNNEIKSAISKFSDYGLIDNREVQLLSILREAMTSGIYKEIDITVGFLFLSGLKELEKEMEKFFNDGGVMRIVMGSITNKETYEVLAATYHSLEDLKRVYNKRVFLNQNIENEKKIYLKTIGVMDQTVENERFLEKLTQWIHEEKLKIRIYTREFMHAKAYLFKPKEGMVAFGSVGSSNFSLAGLFGNTELNSIVTTTHFKNLRDWFEKIWKDSEEFNPAFIDILSTSWSSQVPGKFPKPYLVLMRGLMELYTHIGKEEEKGIMAKSLIGELYDFQMDAVRRAIKIIEKYNGVLISDVVGLGKSYIGLALLEHFSLLEMFDKGRSKVAVFAPPNLVPMWESYLNMFGLNGKVFSTGLLLRGIKEENGIIYLSPRVMEISEELKSVGVVLVDEAHRFSNPSSNSYVNLQFLLPDKKVILLTATPYRKSFEDIINQIRLFMPGKNHKFPITPTKWDDIKKLVKNDLLDPSYILREIMVRRTRRDIVNQYGDKKEERCIRKGKEKECFPERILETVTYNISSIYSLSRASPEDIVTIVRNKDGTYYIPKDYFGNDVISYNNIYEVLVAGIRTLLYARYNLHNYVKENMKDKSPYRDLERAGINLRGIMKTHYLKRLESSAHAYYLSLKKSIAITESFLKLIDKGYLAIGKEFDDLLYKDEDNPRTLTDEEIDELIKEMGTEEDSPLRKYKIGAFKIKELKEDLNFDLKKLKAMLHLVEDVHKEVMKKPWMDKKLKKLAEIIDNILYYNDRRKVLIFSEFEDTVKWIYNGLQKMVENGKVKHPDLWKNKMGYATASTKNVENIAARFSPKSMSKTSVRAQYITREEELDILITTDVMSQGMNLQDANYVVNYDLHWAPYKLIQRVGRIDRIGSEYDKIYVINFLPESDLDKNLKLVEKVKNRAEELSAVLGTDGKIVTEEDRVVVSAMEAIYGGNFEKVEEIAEKEVLSITTAAEKTLEEFIEKYPNDYEKLKNVISIRSAAIHNSPKTVAFFVCSDGINPQYYTYEYVNGEWKRTYLSLDYFLSDKINLTYDTPPYNQLDMKMYWSAAEQALKDYKNMLKDREGVKGKITKIRSKNIKAFIDRLKKISQSLSKDDATRSIAAKYRDLLIWGYSNIPSFKKVVEKVANNTSWRRIKDDKFIDNVKHLLDMWSIPARKKEIEKISTEKGENYLRPHITAGLILIGENYRK